MTDSVSYGRLNDANYSGVSGKCVSVTQIQHSSIVYAFKVDDQKSQIRLSIFILGGLCIVMILLHLSFSVIIRNILQFEPFFIQIEERNHNFIWYNSILVYVIFIFLEQITALLAICIMRIIVKMVRKLQNISAIWYNHAFSLNESVFTKRKNKEKENANKSINRKIKHPKTFLFFIC